jgi:hypothetical protein
MLTSPHPWCVLLMVTSMAVAASDRGISHEDPQEPQPHERSESGPHHGWPCQLIVARDLRDIAEQDGTGRLPSATNAGSSPWRAQS